MIANIQAYLPSFHSYFCISIDLDNERADSSDQGTATSISVNKFASSVADDQWCW